MKCLISAVGFVLVFACHTFAREYSAFACITAYWHREGSGEHASWNGGRLHNRHCAVDPKKIPFGSEVVFPDSTCVAVDSGPDVVNRKSARSCGRNAAEREAIVVDRFFDTKQEALAWAKAHPHFMTVQVLTPGTRQGNKLVAEKIPTSCPTDIAIGVTTGWGGRSNDFQQWLNFHWMLPTSPWR